MPRPKQQAIRNCCLRIAIFAAEWREAWAALGLQMSGMEWSMVCCSSNGDNLDKGDNDSG